MANVLAKNDTADTESAAIGPARGEELQWLGVECDNAAEPTNYERQITRKVDGVVYDQSYLEPTEENLRLILEIAEQYELKVSGNLASTLDEIKSLLVSGDQERISAYVAQIQQIRLFDARDKDISKEVGVKVHPITIDLKFKPGGNELTRTTLKFRANENGDESMCAAIDAIKAAYETKGKKLGNVRRYIIAYEYLPPTIVEAIKRVLDIKEIEADVLAAISEEFAVKLDVRYDVVTTPKGKEVKIVTREAEVNGKPDQKDAVNWQLSQIQRSLDRAGHATFVPAAFDFGTLALSQNPDEVIDQIIRTKELDVTEIRNAMNEQVDRVLRAFPDNEQIVVDLPEKAKVLSRLTTVGDLEKMTQVVKEILEAA